MASRKKSVKKSSATKKATASKSKKNIKTEDQQRVEDELIIWVTLAVCILLLISNFGMGGIVGKFFKNLMIQGFGVFSYVFPVLLFAQISVLVSNKKVILAYIKVLASIILAVDICTFICLIRQNGGYIGESVTNVLMPALGMVGTFVILVVIAIICIVVISQKAILHGAHEKGSEVAKNRKEQMQQRRQENLNLKKERQAEKSKRRTAIREEKRKDHPVKGVSFDTTFENEKKKSKSDLVELKPEVEKISEEHPIAMNSTEDKKDLDSFAMEPVIKRSTPLSSEQSKDMVSDEIPITIANSKKQEKESLNESDTPQDSAASVAAEIDATKKSPVEYKVPPISLLKKGKTGSGDSDTYLKETAQKLQMTLQNFGVNVIVKNISCGPTVTRYELQPEQGVKVSKIVGLADDIKLNLAAADIRIEAPIPGKAAVGIEVPNKETAPVMLRDLIDTDAFKNHKSKIAFACGKDIAGQPVIADIQKMPHVLIAGATGSGKSVCINTIIMSIIYRATPEEVKLVMIDPKMVELGVYNGIPHLMIPVVTDPKKAAGALNWAVAEMTKRYQLFADSNVRDIKGYNKKVENVAASVEEDKPEKLPQIIIVVDEMADLMMVAPGEVEGAICRLAQLARAAGIHLVLATQRPSVNVITGLIKANMPSRIALAVTSGIDSRTIIDMNGAEKLLGKGDMLFHPAGMPKPERVQGAFVSDEEVQKVVEYVVEKNGNASYNEDVEQQVNTNITTDAAGIPQAGDDRDVYFVEAGKFIIDKDKASIGMLQRMFKIGFNRAARIMDQLSEAGVVGPEEGTKPRKVLMSESEFEQYIEDYV